VPSAFVDEPGGFDRGCVERAGGTGPTWCSLQGTDAFGVPNVCANRPARRNRCCPLFFTPSGVPGGLLRGDKAVAVFTDCVVFVQMPPSILRIGPPFACFIVMRAKALIITGECRCCDSSIC
jgi:hypothetical protein